MGFSKKYVIITAGGRGERMGGEVPKQFLDLGGEPILRRTMELFSALPFDVEVIVAINPNMTKYWREYCTKTQFFFRHVISTGGITRFHSVKNALRYVKTGSLVAIHDGVRPLASIKMITDLYEAANDHQAVIPYIDVADSMRGKCVDGTSNPVDRKNYFLVQTPQVFQSDVLLDSYQQPYNESFTDDATVVEAKKYPLTFVKGSRLNIKITTPDDLLFARSVFGREIVNPNLPFDSLVK